MYICPLCHNPVRITSTCCDISFRLTEDTIIYDSNKLLYDFYKKDYFLNKSLNNNGTLGYELLPGGSLSLPERKDVKSFADFIHKHHTKGNVLDVGCGTMAVPGYLTKLVNTGCNFYGLEPIENTKFAWNKIIGTAEFIPLHNNFIDSAIVATSLDHVCNLDKSISEISRVTKNNGTLLIWHSFPILSPSVKRMNLVKRILDFLHISFDRLNYYYYKDQGVVFNIPRGAVDPFHREYIKSESIIKIARRHGLFLEHRHDYDGSSEFLKFVKRVD